MSIFNSGITEIIRSTLKMRNKRAINTEEPGPTGIKETPTTIVSNTFQPSRKNVFLCGSPIKRIIISIKKKKVTA